MIVITLQNGVTPALQRLQSMGQNLRPVMRAIGNELLSITKGNFSALGAEFRPHAWPAKSDGKPSNLRKTGTLAGSFRLTYGSHSATISTDRPYAQIHQFGGRTSPHVIRPRKAKALAFTSAKIGKTVIVRSVNHPGSNIPARPFFPVVGDHLTPLAKTYVVRAAEDALHRMAQRQMA